ncbi:4Fe-4S binding protein, partial [bacterium]|nr:4Fe-4S binding protein [bacterium]
MTMPHATRYGRIIAQVAVICTLLLVARASAVEKRFPTPDFESGYVLPATPTPAPRLAAFEYLDVVVLLLALAMAAWLVHRQRSRRSVVILMLFCLLYFGFWKKGCVCAVGSWQNVVLAISDGGYALPLTVLGFFILPLVFALFFGRVFCAAVCPLGAIQDLAIIRPIRLPAGLRHVLGLVPYLYLGTATLLAATGSAFLTCRFDPFVGLFRLSASLPMLVTGGVILLLGTVVARPYCRFLCPYGVLLGWASALSRQRVTITPTECVQCRLCENACPFDAIHAPTSRRSEGPQRTVLRRTAVYTLLTPLLVLAGLWAGPRLSSPLAHMDRRVQLVEQLDREEAAPQTEMTLQSEAFRGSGVPETAARADALALRKRLRLGGGVLGAFIGLIIGCKLAGLAVGRERKDYEPDSASCQACGRCFEFCPKEHERRTA